MNHAAINNVISVYYDMGFMLAAVWLLIKSAFSIRIRKALAHTHQKPRTYFICEDVVLAKRVQSRVTSSKARMKNEKEEKVEILAKIV